MSDLIGNDAPAIDRRGTKLRNPTFLRATVRKAETVVGRIRRITIAGPALTSALPCPPAAKARLFLPEAGHAVPEFPVWSPQGLVWPPGCRTVMRSYTIRRQVVTAGSGEIDVDMLLHDNGPGGAWARAVRPGDQVGMVSPEPGYTPHAATATHLLVGDEVALPTIAAIRACLPADAHVLTVVETGDPGFRDYLPNESVTWLSRGEHRPGTLLVPYVRQLVLARPGLQAFVAAEASPTRHLRDYLRSRYRLSLADGTLYAKGFWKSSPAR